jgi:hypothetical protein
MPQPMQVLSNSITDKHIEGPWSKKFAGNITSTKGASNNPQK